MSTFNYEILEAGDKPIKAWTKGVPFDAKAHEQLRNLAALPFVGPWVAVMPDVHVGIGATVGSVIPTRGAIIPAAVGVDIGCGMAAVRTSLHARQLPDDLAPVRSAIERSVPVGSADHRQLPDSIGTRLAASGLEARLERIRARHPKLRPDKVGRQLGTLGGGNHFIELCLDEDDAVWVMLHSGSRGTGNVIGTYFIEQARRALEKRVLGFRVPDRDLAFFLEGEPLFDDYIAAVAWAQDYARHNREAMMERVLRELRRFLPKFRLDTVAVNCHHNYVEREQHHGESLLVTRKGAVSAAEGQLGIIPGSMGTRSYIVRGKGNADSFHSCSHGAGRVMSRGQAKQEITLKQHREATAHVECRKDAGVLDESPAAYKPIEAVMAAQADLVDIVHELRQVLCVKG
ncbi:RtcB family protein [Arenimonas composti]|uniref:3'-phosphate/5'-hydroxy nucleic acid ligase n=1 Tax=Arenimonas composti TR7-09 = DSM 18010 TaxID=1121013 RepID=A0A091B9V7_9GAMM|nr:RtcB family protein [Arenimonas composti]KFN49423.1 RTCB protein [Arenimonas composti TR7-09 = DSM 18010]